MNKFNFSTLMIESNPNQIHELNLDKEQTQFYLEQLPTNLCSRDTLFNVLALVQKTRPQIEIDFFENILLLTKCEFYKVNCEAIPAVPAHQNTIADVFNDIHIKPELKRDLVLICHDNTIVSPVMYCGKHFHTPGRKEVRPNTIYKWAYQEDLFSQIGIPPMDPERSKQIDEQIEAELKAQSGYTTILDVIFDALKDAAKEASSNKPKHPFH